MKKRKSNPFYGLFALLALVGLFLFLKKNCAHEPPEPMAEKAKTEAATKKEDSKKGTSKAATDAPEHVLETLAFVKKNGEAPPGFVGGRVFQNREKRLPKSGSGGQKIEYREWDVWPKENGKNRGAERLVTGSDGSAWWTTDHYKSFKKLE